MANSTLLLADDSVTIQKVVNLTFSGEGIDVISVGDGNSALDELRENPPDLVMADVNIPGVNGYEICEKVKSMDLAREIPVILLVGSFEPFDQEEARRVGANAHLTKPFESIAALVELVQGYLTPGKPKDTPIFDDTVEYPSDHNMVVSASSIPFAGGFEDETIEAQSVGGQPAPEEPEQEQDEAFEPVAGFEDAVSAESDGSASQWQMEEEPVEEEPAEYEIEYNSDDFEEPAYADGGAEEPFEPAGNFEAAEDSPVEFLSHETSEFDSNEGPVYQDDQFDPQPVYPDPFDPPVPAEDQEEFTPVPYSAPEDDRSDTMDIGSVTVELDEAELLELPVEISTGDLSPAEADEPEPVQLEDPYAQTYREDAFAVARSQEPVESGDGVSDELVEAVARRVVEMLSDRAVREIAWEVVPDLAEIIIRRIAEEKYKD